MTAPFSFTTPKLNSLMAVLGGPEFGPQGSVREVTVKPVQFPKMPKQKVAPLWQKALAAHIQRPGGGGHQYNNFRLDGSIDDFTFYGSHYNDPKIASDFGYTFWLKFLYKKNPAVESFEVDSHNRVIITLKSVVKLPDLSDIALEMGRQYYNKRAPSTWQWDPKWGDPNKM
jgi:hypothetical protein